MGHFVLAEARARRQSMNIQLTSERYMSGSKIIREEILFVTKYWHFEIKSLLSYVIFCSEQNFFFNSIWGSWVLYENCRPQNCSMRHNLRQRFQFEFMGTHKNTYALPNHINLVQTNWRHDNNANNSSFVYFIEFVNDIQLFLSYKYAMGEIFWKMAWKKTKRICRKYSYYHCASFSNKFWGWCHQLSCGRHIRLLINFS